MRKHVAQGAAAKGNERTARMGTGPIPKLVLEFAIPSIVGMLVNECLQRNRLYFPWPGHG